MKPNGLKIRGSSGLPNRPGGSNTPPKVVNIRPSRAMKEARKASAEIIDIKDIGKGSNARLGVSEGEGTYRAWGAAGVIRRVWGKHRRGTLINWNRKNRKRVAEKVHKLTKGLARHSKSGVSRKRIREAKIEDYNAWKGGGGKGKWEEGGKWSHADADDAAQMYDAISEKTRLEKIAEQERMQKAEKIMLRSERRDQQMAERIGQQTTTDIRASTPPDNTPTITPLVNLPTAKIEQIGKDKPTNKSKGPVVKKIDMDDEQTEESGKAEIIELRNLEDENFSDEDADAMIAEVEGGNADHKRGVKPIDIGGGDIDEEEFEDVA